MADEPPVGNVAAMVRFMLLRPKSNGSCTKQIHPLRASPVPVREFHDFRPTFPFSCSGTRTVTRILLFSPLRASPVPVREFHDFRPTFPFSRFGQ